jgi:hypothetical protein
LHHSVLANKLASIAWAVLNRDSSSSRRQLRLRSNLRERGALCSGRSRHGLQTLELVPRQLRRPALAVPVRQVPHHVQARTKERPHGTNKGTALIRRERWHNPVSLPGSARG